MEKAIKDKKHQMKTWSWERSPRVNLEKKYAEIVGIPVVTTETISIP